MNLVDHSLSQARRRRGFWLIGAVLLGFILVPLLAIVAMRWRYHRIELAIAALDRQNAIAHKEGVIESPWLPAALFPRRLPKSITVRTAGARTKTIAPLLRNVPCIDGLEFTDSELSVEELNAVSHLRELKRLSLARSNISNQSLFTLLQSHEQLRELDVSDTAINDELFVELDSLPSLRKLNIANTATTLAVVRSFESSHPSVTIHWRPPLTSRQKQCRDTLLKHGFSVYDEYGPLSILDEHEWMVGLPLKGLPSDADWHELSSLDGVLHLHLKGPQYTIEMLPLFAALSKLREVTWEVQAISATELRQIASLAHIRWRLIDGQRCYEVRDGKQFRIDERGDSSLLSDDFAP